jgi:hypothetical protein
MRSSKEVHQLFPSWPAASQQTDLDGEEDFGGPRTETVKECARDEIDVHRFFKENQ